MTDTSPARTSRIVEPLQPLAIPAVNLMTDPENARRGDVAAVKRSLNVFGQRKPIVVKKTGTDADGRPTGIIMAGNHTYAAALELGWTEIAAVFVDDDAATAKAYALADNRIGELAVWDMSTLAAHLSELSADEFDMAALGWSDTDLATLLHGNTPPSLEALASAAGEPQPSDTWPTLHLRCAPHIAQAWADRVSGHGGTDNAVLAELLGLDPELPADVWTGDGPT